MTTPPPFTRQLPANYESSSDPFVLFHPPEPTATSVEWRMLDGKWQKAEGPDMARREGMVTTVRGRNLGANDRMNREEGRQYMWCPMADYVAAMGQPDTTPDTAPLLARIASLEAEIQALRAQVKAGIKRELEYRERITELRDDATNTLRALTTPTSSTETEKL